MSTALEAMGTERSRNPGGGRIGARRLAASMIIVLTVILPGCSRRGRQPPERIILIVVDTLRRDKVSCYETGILTPGIDALAKRGQIFTNAHAAFHQTTVSMASLFTGRTPSLESGKGRASIGWDGATACGLYRFSAAEGRSDCIPRSLPTLAEQMRRAGYWTIGVTSNAALYDPNNYSRGFNDWVEIEGKWYGGEKPEQFKRYTLPAQSRDRGGEAVDAAVSRAVERRPKDRFFLYAHFMDAHDYDANGVPYEKGVADADMWVDRMLARLEEAGLLKDSVVVLTADHGERLGESQVVPGTPFHYGNPSFEQVLWIPLIVSPARFQDASRLIRSDDIFRMLESIAGIADKRKSDLEPGELFVSEDRYQTYVKGPWKSFRDRSSDREILVNLETDPGETTNVAAAHPEVMQAHARRADELAKALATPPPGEKGFSELQRERLKSLGYVQ